MSRKLRSSARTNFCADTDGTMNNGTEINLYECGPSALQNFAYDTATRRIVHLASGKCLDAYGFDNQTPVGLWDCHDGNNQKWERANGAYRVAHVGRCLDVPGQNFVNGQRLKIHDCNGTAAQQFEPLDEFTSRTPSEGQAVGCITEDYRAIYRFTGGQLRAYPNPDIANSWDPNWGNFLRTDCRNLPRGAPMEMKPPPAPTFPSCSGTGSSYSTLRQGEMYPGETISQCSSLRSPNGNVMLVMQSDGNAVVYDRTNNRAIWSTGTNGRGTQPYRLVYQDDRNFVLYDGNNSALWSTRTNGQSSRVIRMQDDGNLVIYDGFPDSAGRGGSVRFASNSFVSGGAPSAGAGNAPCRRDQDTQQLFGINGASAKGEAVKWCSDQGKFGIADGGRIIDCGAWYFSAQCGANRPGDWSQCFRDETARQQGFANRNAQAEQDCKNRGYVGIDPGTFKDCGEWHFSVKCANPNYLGSDWNDDGCRDYGNNATRRYARQVGANGLDWDRAADWLIASNGTPKVGQQWKGGTVTSVSKENKGAGGMWVVVMVKDAKCKSDFFVFDEPDTPNECRSDGTRRMTKRCNRWPTGWVASSDVVRYCDQSDSKPAGSTVKQFGSEVWAEWTTPDASCQPSYLGADWNNDGCLANGNRRYARQVDAKGMDWDRAADILMSGSPNVGEQFKGGRVISKRKERTTGMWIILEVEDALCQPAYLSSDWNDDGCRDYGNNATRRYARQVDAKAMDWDVAADRLIASDATPKVNSQWKDGTVTSISKENKGAGGMWVVVMVRDAKCKSDFFVFNEGERREECNSDGTRTIRRQCRAWPTGWVASGDVVRYCDQSDSKPAGSTVKQFGTEVWAEWTTPDTVCLGEWKSGSSWIDNNCQKDQTRRYARQVEAYKRDWATAVDYVNANSVPNQVDGKMVLRKEKDINPAIGAFSVVYVKDTACEPSFKGSDWNDDGCKDGERTYARQVDDKSMGSWETASQILIDSLPKVGEQFKDRPVTRVWSENKGTAGMWIYIKVKDSTCLGEWKFGSSWIDNNCQKDQTRRYARQVDVHDQDWGAAVDHANKTLITEQVEGKIVLRKEKDINSAVGAFSVVYVKDTACEPSFKGPDWNDDGCKDGERTYARQVDDKSMGSWETAAQILIDSLPKVGEQFKDNEITRVWSENKGTAGMWIYIKVKDSTCLGEWKFGSSWIDNNCQKDQTRRYARQVDAHDQDWGAAVDHVNANSVPDQVEGKIVLRKEKDINPAVGAFSVVYVKDTACEPSFKGSDWNDDGCKDGERTYARQVDDKSMGSWETAAQILIDSLPKVGEQFKDSQITRVWSENKGTAGMWIYIKVKDSTCLGEWKFGSSWIDNNCQKDGSRRYARQVDAHDQDWATAVDHVNTTSVTDQVEGKMVIRKEKDINPAVGAFSIVYTKDPICEPSYLGSDWNDDGCDEDGTRGYSRQVDAKQMSWEDAAEQLIKNVGTRFKGSEVVRSWSENKGAAGMWIHIKVKDTPCEPSFKGDDWQDNGCQGKIHRYSRQIDRKQINLEKAAKILIDKLPSIGEAFKNGKLFAKSYENNMVIVDVDDTICNPVVVPPTTVQPPTTPTTTITPTIQAPAPTPPTTTTPTTTTMIPTTITPTPTTSKPTTPTKPLRAPTGGLQTETEKEQPSPTRNWIWIILIIVLLILMLGSSVGFALL